ncbi:DcaP family trimeric outer membrane transporter [Aliiglaciecola sp. 3_MG-2023]|uniref:DcaP family trimeric outer membrane transporter n=1 Tax=Aliiglaciecola sp. 3_MG-2023 TaxID=3062644 RepID=UPI0026E35956|nr:DcaP family trimeric outer membrane transporter [Aliiglaciecola sp. 3_MG-2023]MDO6694637.1 DcaP family trimeric outer membrane transporter [Aliiglaciecola sp. 3_MG-2023]
MSSKFKKATIAAIFGIYIVTPFSHAIEIFHQDDGEHVTTVSLGGYAKVDLRHVNGDVAYQDYWVGNFPGGEATDTSHTGFNVRESRINMKVSHDDVSGFFEIDFYGGGGNEIISNSSNVRIRHGFINYQNWLAGQTWSTFMPLNVIPETLDFGGPHVGEVFIRAVQLRYTYGNWQFAVENPETWGDDDVGTPSSALGLTGDEADADESIPDFVVRYNYQNDWGSFAVAGLLRKVDQGGINETTAALNVSGKIDSVGKDDFRFQVTLGEPGRYASTALTTDIVVNPDNQQIEVEQSLVYTLAYRHYWSETLRSTAFYGAAETDVAEKKRAHWGLNLIESLTDSLNVGVEVGNYRVADPDIESVSSNYLQFSAQYSF